jgi:hypothetical protein
MLKEDMAMAQYGEEIKRLSTTTYLLITKVGYPDSGHAQAPNNVNM